MTKEKKIAFQGIHGSYSDVACRSLQPGCETIGHDSFKGCIDAVLSGAADFALIPIENSATGTYLFNYDLIDSDKLFIVNEYLSHEQHCLLALPGTKLADVTVIKSHPYAIDQCRGWLDTRAGKSVTVAQAADTAGVAKEISAGKLTNVAAIAGRHAAEMYGLEVIEAGIEDSKNTITRYLLLSPTALEPERHQNPKTSISVLLKNQTGAFFKALSCFALRGIHINKLESRPSARSITLSKPWEYVLYVDFDGSLADANVKNALTNLQEFAKIHHFGSYPRFAGFEGASSLGTQGSGWAVGSM